MPKSDLSASVTRPLLLIADDDRDTREMFAFYLRMVGYDVEAAADGHEAVVKACTLHPDLIVMDLEMPKIDGWSAIRQLQSESKTAAIPIVVLTGHEFKVYLEKVARAAGATSYLMKPCLPERLAHEVAGRLQQHRVGKAVRRHAL